MKLFFTLNFGDTQLIWKRRDFNLSTNFSFHYTSTPPVYLHGVLLS